MHCWVIRYVHLPFLLDTDRVLGGKMKFYQSILSAVLRVSVLHVSQR